MIFGQKKANPELEAFTNLLSDGIKGLFSERGGEQFSKTPEIVKRDIIEYEGRMRAEGMEKFNDPTYVAYLNYYLNAKDMENNKAIGALVLYVEQSYMVRIMKKLKYPLVDDENEEALKDSCGTLCNLIGGRLKSDLSSRGYSELEMSHFSTFRNKAVAGIPFCFSEYEKYEISFELDKVKRMVVELSMGIVPKR